MSRYARQMILEGVGAEGQARLGAARVLVVGAGGLGVPVLQYLAGAGVGRIVIVDPDRVERSNLHRQTLYGERSLGQAKAAAAAAVLADLNTEVVVEAIVGRLDPASAGPLVATADVVLDCADSFAVSYTLSDACAAAGRPFITASALDSAVMSAAFAAGRRRCGRSFPTCRNRRRAVRRQVSSGRWSGFSAVFRRRWRCRSCWGSRRARSGSW